MPTLDSTQPSLNGPTESSGSGLRRFIHTVLGLIAVCAIALAVWPGLLAAVAPGVGLERFGGTTPFRLLAFVTFAVAMGLRFLINPGKQRSRTSLAWEQFATQAGGVFTNERRKLTASGWEGGPTARWASRGVTVSLSGCTDSSRNHHTRFRADVRLVRPFQFHLMPENLVTKAHFSPQLWDVVLAGVKSPAGQGKAADAQALLAERMAFMAEKEILIGDPLFDKAFLVKSDNPSQAREFFSDAGVSLRLREMNERLKSWQMSFVVSRLPDAYQLTLELPGSVREAEALESGRQVIEAAIGCIADRGMLAVSDPKAA